MKKSYRKPSRHRRVLSIFAQFRLLILDQLNDKLRKRLLRRRLGLNMLQKTSLSINFTQNIKITSTPNKRLHFRNIFFPVAHSPFCDAFASTVGHSRSLEGIRAIGRSLCWDFHPFSVQDSFYLPLISIVLILSFTVKKSRK